MNKFVLVVILLIIFIAGITTIIFVTQNLQRQTATAALFQTVTPDSTPNPANLGWQEITAAAPWQGRDSHAFVVYRNKLWIMGGLNADEQVAAPGNINYGNAKYFSDVWSSEDGVSWKLETDNAAFGKIRSAQAVEFLGKLWLVGGWGPEIGYKSRVWSSEDGVNWKLENGNAAWPAREGHRLLVFQNKMWLIGGVKYEPRKLFNDVWWSSDGINWQEATDNAGWTGRWDHAAEVFQNKMWIAGGMVSGTQLLGDVWWSSDGANWNMATSNPGFSSRQGGGLIDYHGKLWIVSRLNIPEYGSGPNDVWYSDDGKTWQKTKIDPAWTGREDVGVIVFHDKIWVFGGMDSTWHWKGDIWASTF